MPVLTPTQATTFKAKLLADCITINRKPTGTTGTYLPANKEYILPGALYEGYGQYIWDSFLTAGAATSFLDDDSTLMAGAKQWLLNWATRQRGGNDDTTPDANNDGALPASVSPTTEDFSQAQPPLFAWAILKLYNAGAGLTFVGQVYPIARRFYNWWLLRRDDTTTGLASNGTYLTSYSSAAVDATRYETGQDRVGLYGGTILGDGPFADLLVNERGGGGYIASICPPDLNALLVQEADCLAQLATLQGLTSAAATFTAQRDARKLAMNRLMWDEIAGLYRPVQRTAQTTAVGTSGAASSAATTVTLTASGASVLLPKGVKLRFSGGAVGQVATTTLVTSGGTAVPLTASGLSGAVAGAEIVRRYDPVTFQTLGNLVMPLWCGIPDSTKAGLIRNDLMRSFDGATPDTFELYMGSSLTHFIHKRLGSVLFDPYFSPDGGANAFSVASFDMAGGRSEGLRLTYRANGSSTGTGGAPASKPFLDAGGTGIPPEQYQYFNESLEQVDAAHPLTVNIDGTQSGSSRVTVALYSKAGTQVGTTQQIDLASGTGSVTFSPGTAVTPGWVAVGTSSGTGTISLRRAAITLLPRGYKYYNPGVGTQAVPRLQYAYFPPLERGAINNLTANGINDIWDYWLGDCWINLEYMAAMGLRRYSLDSDALAIATDTVSRTYSESEATGFIWERYNAKTGQGKGAQQYGWSALAQEMVTTFGLVGSAVATTNIAFAGDSLTYGENSSDPGDATDGHASYPAQVITLLGGTEFGFSGVNLGISGQSAEDAVGTANRNAVRDAFDSSADTNVLSVMFGTNDLGNPTNPTNTISLSVSAAAAVVKARMVALIAAYAEDRPWGTIYVLTIPPAAHSLYPSDFNARRDAYNTLLLAGVSGATVLDTTHDAEIGVSGMEQDAAYFNSTDKTHLSDAGYARLARYPAHSIDSSVALPSQVAFGLTAGTLSGPTTTTKSRLNGFSFTAATDGTAPYTYQPQYKRAADMNWVNAAGATSSPFSLIGLLSSTSYNTRVRTTDSAGDEVYSNTVTVSTAAPSAAPIGEGGGMGFSNIVSGVRPCILDQDVQAPASTCGLRILADGNVTFIDREGTENTIAATAGTDYNSQVKRVLSNGTDVDAEDIMIAYAAGIR